MSGFTTQACRRNHFAVIPDVHPSLFDCCGNLSLQIGAILLDIGVAAEFAGPSHEQRFVIPCGDSQTAGTPWRWNYIYAIVEPLAHFYARCLSRIYAPLVCKDSRAVRQPKHTGKLHSGGEQVMGESSDR